MDIDIYEAINNKMFNLLSMYLYALTANKIDPNKKKRNYNSEKWKVI